MPFMAATAMSAGDTPSGIAPSRLFNGFQQPFFRFGRRNLFKRGVSLEATPRRCRFYPSYSHDMLLYTFKKIYPLTGHQLHYRLFPITAFTGDPPSLFDFTRHLHRLDSRNTD